VSENLRKILKVSHFLLLFSVCENTNESKRIYRNIFGFLVAENPEQNSSENLKGVWDFCRAFTRFLAG